MQERIAFMKSPMQPEIAQFARHDSCAVRLGSGVAHLADRSAMATLPRPAGCKAAQRHKPAQVFAAVYAGCAGVPLVPPFFQLRTWPNGQISGKASSPLCAGFAHNGVEAATALRNATVFSDR